MAILLCYAIAVVFLTLYINHDYLNPIIYNKTMLTCKKKIKLKKRIMIIVIVITSQ